MKMGAAVLVWCLVVLSGAGAHISQNMRALSAGLERDMAETLELLAVNYSAPRLEARYVATVEFDMRAMGPLYNNTHRVIDVIAKPQAYPPGIVSIQDGKLEVAPPREQWRPLLAHYAGPTAVLCAALLLAAALPLAGVFWCCCQCCRGRRRRPFDRKYDACLKGILAIVFICLLTLFLFGVVCLFATDAQVEAGAAEAGGALRAGLRDARTFLNTTAVHARWLLVVNWRELASRLDAALLASGVVVSGKLAQFSRAVSVTSLSALVASLDDVQHDLRRVQECTRQLRTHADRLNTGLRSVRRQLLETLASCDQPKCKALQTKYNIGQLDTEIQYSQMPDVSELLENVSRLLASDMKQEVEAGQQVFRDIQLAIRRSVAQHIPSVQQSIAETGDRLENLSNEITWKAGNLSEELKQQERAADELERLHAQYGPYRRYVGLLAAAAPLLITCVFAWGLTCGVCGKRPDHYGASDCCNKGAGSKCLLCGVGLIFLLGGVMALVLAVYFAVGVASQRFICDPLTEPRGNRLMADLERYVDLERELYNERADPEFNLTSVLLHCHANDTIFQTLQLQRRYNFDDVRTEMSVGVRARVSALRPEFPTRTVTILRPAARARLAELARSPLAEFDFDRILQALESNMTSLALDSLAAQLEGTARGLPAQYAAQGTSLRRAADSLRRLGEDVLAPMVNYTDQLNSTASRLRDELRFNHKSMKEAIDFLIKETTEAELFLNTQGPERLQNITQTYAGVLSEQLEQYLAHVWRAARLDVGRCGPLSNAFNATRDAACHKILMPTNGYWMALAWCAVLFVPLVLVAQKLARLYLHADPYPGPLVEAEYLYDAYADRDNVPLANAYKAEKRGGGARSAGGAGGRGAREGAGPAGPAPHDAHHARRYNDMAPKHWEEGPPRYHGPTEYERPPPYYYPGPNSIPRAQLASQSRLYYFYDGPVAAGARAYDSDRQ